MPRGISKEKLETLYRQFNRREFVHPDPLEFLYRYKNPRDREIAALISSSLAYGRVAQILKSVSFVLNRMPSPFTFLQEATLPCLRKTFEGFRHRFTTSEDLSRMLSNTKKVLKKYGSLHACFAAWQKKSGKTVLSGLSGLAGELAPSAPPGHFGLLPSPAGGSACKRLNLFLRWMVRKDEVDPGGWHEVCPSKLVIPLDAHMQKVGHALGFTKRKQPDLLTALEVTTGFRLLSPQDPVRYDFALTRLGIRKDKDLGAFLREGT